MNIQTAELQKPKLTREQMTAWFEQFRHGDPANREFQKRLIDTFVNAVYVFDDKLVLTYNYQHGTQTISLEEIESALSSDFDGAAPPKGKDRRWRSFPFGGTFCRDKKGETHFRVSPPFSGTAYSPSSLPQVPLPAMPSAPRLYLVWNCFSAASVPAPKSPSAPAAPQL